MDPLRFLHLPSCRSVESHTAGDLHALSSLVVADLGTGDLQTRLKLSGLTMIVFVPVFIRETACSDVVVGAMLASL